MNKLLKFIYILSALLLFIGVLGAILDDSSSSKQKEKNTKKQSHKILITKAQYGSKWAFSDFDSAYLGCKKINGYEAVYLEVQGVKLALNGYAKNYFAKIDPYWLDDKQTGAKKPLTPFIQEGLKLCNIIAE